jgi:hypothetical protein
MTAWQDLPPRTRRQARMNERENPADEFEHAPKQSDEDSTPPESSGDSVERQDLVTAYSRRSRRAAGAPSGEEQAAPFRTSAPALETPQPEYRVRDFRPGQNLTEPADRSAATPAGEPMRDVPRWSPPGQDDGGRLSYQTQATPMAAPPTPSKAVIDSVPAELAAPPRPMTRRELRELEIKQGTRPQADDGPAAEAPQTEAPQTEAPRAEHPVPASAAPPAQQQAPPAPPVVHLAPAVPIPMPAPSTASAARPVVPPVVSPEPVVFTDASGTGPANRPPVAPMPVRQQQAPSQSTAGSLAINRGVDAAPEIFSAPDAHWQTQTNIDTANQAGDAFIRRVGGNGSASTTNALVIPSIPQASDITRPFSSTGEILVTGSIDLPITLGSTGANPARFDHSDIDALFAQEDHDYAPADAAPVRAIRAVSTHTSTHGVISAKKPANNRLPMMMAVTAGILAVSVAALFAAALIFGYL